MLNQTIETPPGLLDKVLQSIETERRKTARRRFVAANLGLCVLSILLVPALNHFSSELTQSGFISFVSLAFLNFSAVLAHWQDFALSLLESFPVVSAMEVLILLGLLVATVSTAMAYSKTLFTKPLALT